MKIKNILFVAGLMLMSSSCSDYLDVVPDNTPTLDHVFADRNNAEGFLFTCYNSLPDFGNDLKNPAFFAGGEAICTSSGYSNERNWSDVIPSGQRVLMGQQNSNSPYFNYWDGGNNGNNLYVGIRNCNIFLENIDKPIDLKLTEKERWIAEVKFLKAYYHYLLLEMYGPIPITDTNIAVDADPDKVRVYRDPVEDVVNYIVKELDEAVDFLPGSIDNELTEMGRITQPIAKALKAKVLALAASPLFNGNADYKDFVDSRGVHLFPQEYDKNKWKLAADATLDAIKCAEENGHKLYKFKSMRTMSDSTVNKMSIRGAVTDNYNKEIIWGQATKADHIQRNAMPSVSDQFSNTIFSEMSVPLSMVDMFYSKNGVPINEDKTYDYEGRYNVQKISKADSYYMATGEETAAVNMDRETRFYADLAFDRSLLYGAGNLDDKDQWVIKARRQEQSGKRSDECYNLTGYFPVKVVQWESTYSNPQSFNCQTYHFPLIRLADLYLLYAECQTEYSDQIDPSVYEYIDKVRERASLKGVIESWAAYSSNPDKPKNKAGLLEIIHRERQIELAFEGQSFWDLRRWTEWDNVVNQKFQGWNVNATKAADYYKRVTRVTPSSFSRKNYLWPIKQSAIDRNPNLVQNPGWK